MTVRKLIICVAAIAAACDSPAPESASPSNETGVQASAPPLVPEFAPNPGGGNAVHEELAENRSGEDRAQASTSIPSSLHGRWGLTENDCTSTRGDAKGLLDISERQLRFYESRGTPRQIVEAGAGRLVADFDFTGEGQNWQRRMSLELQDDGQTLIRREQGADAMPGALTYRKCGTR